MRAGREFTTSETEESWASGSDVAIVNETLARELFGRTDVVGRTLVQRGYRENATLRIVGVVPDLRESGVVRPPGPVLYRGIGEHPSPFFTLLLRSDRPARVVLESAREALRRLDPAVPPVWARTTLERLRGETAETRFLARLAAVLALAAAFLAAVGLYGLVGHSVAERKRELGIRMALGAPRAGIVRGVMARALLLTLVGVAAGAGLGWILTGALESRLYGIGVLDPVSWIATLGVFTILGPLAATAPARAAVTVDPVRSLKEGSG